MAVVLIPNASAIKVKFDHGTDFRARCNSCYELNKREKYLPPRWV